MDLLKREQAPILPHAWAAIDAEARRVLRLNLAARKIVDFDGPHGFGFAAVNTGRLDMLPRRAPDGPSAALRNVQPLVELRGPIRLDLMELDSISRGADDPDLDAVRREAEAMAHAEDHAVFHGYADAGIAGIIPSSPHTPITIAGASDYPRAVASAKEVLRRAGVDGPYALALGPTLYDEVSGTAEEGYPIRKRIEAQLGDSPLVWAPAIDGGVLVSMRGGDFRLTVGQDFAVGFAFREKHEVELYLTETFTFRILEPAAAIALERA